MIHSLVFEITFFFGLGLVNAPFFKRKLVLEVQEAVAQTYSVKKETLAQVFSCEFCEVSMNTFFYRTAMVAASEVPV